MSRLRRYWPLLVFFLAAVIGPGTAVAQTEPQLRLRLNRDFGTGLGNNIEGTFSFRVTGPDDLVHVSFFIDDQLVGEDSEAPFRLQFKTGDFPLGVHTLHAVGRTQGGQELTSNSLTRNFISGSEANRTVINIVVPIVLLALGGSIISAWIANRGQKAGDAVGGNITGLFGTTVCPKCRKPFAMHIWAPNIFIGKFDRCPHCGKWSVVRRQPADVINVAAQELEPSKTDPHPDPEDTDGWRKRLDDSKYDG